jgi:hypothetical protein
MFLKGNLLYWARSLMDMVYLFVWNAQDKTAEGCSTGMKILEVSHL